MAGLRLGIGLLITLPNEAVGLYIKVSDTGIGIADDKRDKLFDSFHQVDTSMSRKYGGTGLGLAISKPLVDLMHDSLVVFNDYTLGTKFVIDLDFELASGCILYRLNNSI